MGATAASSRPPGAADSEPEVRAAGIGALAQVGEIDDVITAATDRDPRVRAAAAHGIGFLSLRRDVDVATLRLLTQDPDEDVRKEARAGLRRLGVEAIPTHQRRPRRKGDPEWVDLLEKLSARVLADRELAADLPDEALETGWLGTTGATAQQLNGAESRLGLRLPSSYRAFLEISNGWYTTSFLCQRLLPVEEVIPFIESDPQWVQAYGQTDIATALRGAIQVSTITDNGVCLLVPSDAVDCETWWFASWMAGKRSFPSFYDFIRNELES